MIVSACRFCISRKGGTVGGWWDSVKWWGHLQGGMHMVAARLGCKTAMVGTGGPIFALAAWTGIENTTLTL